MPKAIWHQTHHQNILPDCVIKPEKNSLQLIETIFSPRSSANVLAEWESSCTRAGGSPQFDSKRDKNQKFGLEVYCAFTVNLNLETFSSCFLYQEKVRLQTGKGHPTIHVIQALGYVNSARTFLWEVPEKDCFCQHPNKGFLHLMLLIKLYNDTLWEFALQFCRWNHKRQKGKWYFLSENSQWINPSVVVHVGIF